jgi:hypothetical protein
MKSPKSLRGLFDFLAERPYIILASTPHRLLKYVRRGEGALHFVDAKTSTAWSIGLLAAPKVEWEPGWQFHPGGFRVEFGDGVFEYSYAKKVNEAK